MTRSRVGIMGFGRLGRNVFRALYARRDIQVVAISDIHPSEAMEYLLRFDTLKGRFSDPVRIVDNYLYAQGQRIPFLNCREPGEIPWYDFGADVVIEATGQYRGMSDLQKHLDMGADRVILTTPPSDDLDGSDDIGVFVRGVTPEPLDRSQRVVSCGSSTGNCTAVMIKVLDDAFGVDNGFFTSVHAYTTEQSLIDSPNAHDLRLSRAAIENIVPVKSWTQKLIGQLFPHLAGNFGGYKLNVPIPDASCVDLVTILSRDVNVQEINEVFRSAAGSTMEGVISFTDQPIVSSDVVGDESSCLFDSLATMKVGGNMIKTLGWYDQGGGLAHRIVDLIDQFAPRQSLEEPRSGRQVSGTQQATRKKAP